MNARVENFTSRTNVESVQRERERLRLERRKSIARREQEIDELGDEGLINEEVNR
jgi:hypothetical protein